MAEFEGGGSCGALFTTRPPLSASLCFNVVFDVRFDVLRGAVLCWFPLLRFWCILLAVLCFYCVVQRIAVFCAALRRAGTIVCFATIGYTFLRLAVLYYALLCDPTAAVLYLALLCYMLLSFGVPC